MDYQLNSSRSVNVDIGQDLDVKARKHIAIGSGDDLALRSGSASIVMKKDGEVAIKGKDVSLEAAGKIVGKAATSLTRAALRSAHAQRRQSDFIDLRIVTGNLRSSAPGRQLFETPRNTLKTRTFVARSGLRFC